MRIAKIPLSQLLFQFVVFVGSSKFTLWQLSVLGIVVLLYYQQVPYGEALLIAGLLVALVNLASAIMTQAPLRANRMLLLFHVSLAVVVILAGIGRLTYLKGRLELVQDVTFSGELLEVEQGLIHQNSLGTLRFENLGYTIDYRPGLKRNKTVNQVAWMDSEGLRHVSDIGDQHPLILDGYRFYTSFNKGYSLVFTWRRGADLVRGNVNLPSFPAREFEQAQFWRLPDTDIELWSQLVPKESIVTLDEAFVLGELSNHHVVMRYADERFEMVPGDEVGITNGTLYYEGVRQWMGYNVYYDWTRSWMIAACLVAIGAMGLHFLNKFRSSPIPAQ